MAAVALLDELTPADLERLATVVRERSGLAFGEARWPFLRNRAREVMVRARFVSIRRWLEELVASAERRGALYCDLEEALQDHETSFFRYEEHYRALRDHVLPALVRPGGPRVRLCSVGCSTGEEAYSIAMAVRESGIRGVTGMVDIVGLDVSRQALSLAVAGTYPASRLASVPDDHRARYFLSTGDRLTVVPALRQMIRFRHHDVRRGFYIGKFDVIVCCNVLQYFTPAVKQQVLSQLADSLTEGGYLFLGHAEGIAPSEASFVTRGLPAPFMHQRLGRHPASVTLA
jgi:chemotaxis methyl-accepting protein methylase